MLKGNYRKSSETNNSWVIFSFFPHFFFKLVLKSNVISVYIVSSKTEAQGIQIPLSTSSLNLKIYKLMELVWFRFSKWNINHNNHYIQKLSQSPNQVFVSVSFYTHNHCNICLLQYDLQQPVIRWAAWNQFLRGPTYQLNNYDSIGEEESSFKNNL